MARGGWWRHLAVGLGVLLVGVSPTPGWSQTLPAVSAGDEVRVRAPSRVVVDGLVTLESNRVVSQVPIEQQDHYVALRDGDRVVHVPRPGRRLSGRLIGLTDEAIVLRDGDQDLRIPRQAVEVLEVRRGRGDPALGAVVGGSVAFGIGFLIGYKADQDCSGWCMPEVVGASLGLLLALPGAAVGATMEQGHWEPVSTESWRVTLSPRPGGASAAVVLRF